MVIVEALINMISDDEEFVTMFVGLPCVSHSSIFAPKLSLLIAKGCGDLFVGSVLSLTGGVKLSKLRGRLSRL